jgi:hypothetical protein
MYVTGMYRRHHQECAKDMQQVRLATDMAEITAAAAASHDSEAVSSSRQEVLQRTS